MEAVPQEFTHRSIGRIVLIFLSALVGLQLLSAQEESSFPLKATRLNGDQPIITKELFQSAGVHNEKDGANINGPSVIRIPDWIPASKRANPKAVYYMYFAHHQGEFIRLAWAENVEGPWSLYKVSDSLPLEEKGVLSLGVADKIEIGNGILIRNHIASPDVIVDEKNQRIVMYFHGPTNYKEEKNGQKTFVATAPWGLDFNGRIEPVVICEAYARVFEFQGNLYAQVGEGFYRAPSLQNPWETPAGFDFGNQLWTKNNEDTFEDYWAKDPSIQGRENVNKRHSAVWVSGEKLHMLYSRRRDLPERILYTCFDLRKDFSEWKPEGPFYEILQSEFDWEGGNIPAVESKGSSMNCCVHELRDPCIFKDIDGSMYLFYTGQGEDAVGVASLTYD